MSQNDNGNGREHTGYLTRSRNPVTSLILVTHDMSLAARMNQRFELHLGSLQAF